MLSENQFEALAAEIPITPRTFLEKFCRVIGNFLDKFHYHFTGIHIECMHCETISQFTFTNVQRSAKISFPFTNQNKRRKKLWKNQCGVVSDTNEKCLLINSHICKRIRPCFRISFNKIRQIEVGNVNSHRWTNCNGWKWN